MCVYLIVKTLHVLSATVLFGTGAGIAFFMLKGQMSGVPAARRFSAATTATADFLFTLPMLSATVLFGTGAGIAFFMLKGQMSGVPAARRFSAATTVTADFLFTLPAVIIQPLSGAWLVWRGGFDATDRWLVITYGLYLLAGLCWLPV